MKNITVQISEEELREVAEAYKTLQKFLEKIVPLNELYTDEFLQGLQEAQEEVENKEITEVKDFADFTR